MVLVHATESAAAQRIRAAAIASFAEFGYAGTSTRQITARLGMSAAAMYPHFRSKEELLYSIALEGHQAVNDAMRAADEPSAPYPDRLRAVVAAFAEWQARHHQLAKVVQYEMRALRPEHFRAIADLRHETTAMLTTIITAGVQAGEFLADDADDVILAISSLCVDVCRWFPSRTHRDPVRLGVAYARMASRMVRAEESSGHRSRPGNGV
ncbi:TetR/AcrR family transcriptional regulator [Gordonia sp. L191]|uniref:TetR/AcrR family transcriptional regulator n=1 Tax=Gordonia sp. L191 TaxID=2982699 RepID=UPI0024C05B0B|nr:TetR/AcrR family transcriptional regulator [Gordonia sp. L191]WHU48469.1 TetR/AcrR family transcriptional regulator [Gordonia sp. L191]